MPRLTEAQLVHKSPLPASSPRPPLSGRQPFNTIRVSKSGAFVVAEAALSSTQCGWRGSTTFDWHLHLVTLTSALDAHGFILNNGELAAYFNTAYDGTLPATFHSCEQTAIEAASHFLSRLIEEGHHHSTVRVEATIVNPFGTEFTAVRGRL